MVWFFTILRVAYRVITGRGAEDARSDDEEYVCLVYVYASLIFTRSLVSEEDEDEDEKKDQ